jgi:GntR family transcriptional regulator
MVLVYAPVVPVDPDSPVPLYRQVAAELRNRVASERLTRLPSLLSIQQEYDVSRPTAEAAVKILIDAGEAYVVPGKGTYVRGRGEPPPAGDGGS